MSSIDITSLTVQIGKCNISCKSPSKFAVSLQINQNTSAISQAKTLEGSCINFNTILRLPIQKQLINDSHPVCQVLLHQINRNLDNKVIRTATIQFLVANNKGFQCYNFQRFESCSDNIEVSVICGESQQMGVKSEYDSKNNLLSTQQLPHESDLIQQGEDQSLGNDSILDKEENDYLLKSKVQSSINARSRKSLIGKSNRISRPQDLHCLSPSQLIQHYQTQLSEFEQVLNQKQDWANGMKQLVQQLQAENQLLKQLAIQQLAENDAANYQQGIQLVSKLVQSQFQASKSMFLSPVSRASKGSQKYRQDENEFDSKISLNPTKSQKNFSNYQDNLTTKPQKDGKSILPIAIESLQYLQNPKRFQASGQQQNLQEQIFKVRQQNQELNEVTENLYQELTQIKNQLKNANKTIQQMKQQIYTIKAENNTLRQQYRTLSKPHNQQISQNQTQFNDYEVRISQLQHQLQQSFQAIEDFKKKSTDVRPELAVKQTQENDQTKTMQNAQSEHTQLLSVCGTLQSSIQERQLLRQSLGRLLLSGLTEPSPVQDGIKRLQGSLNKMFAQIVKHQSLKDLPQIQKLKQQINGQVNGLLCSK